jgi:hypothetical protein
MLSEHRAATGLPIQDMSVTWIHEPNLADFEIICGKRFPTASSRSLSMIGETRRLR